MCDECKLFVQKVNKIIDFLSNTLQKKDFSKNI
jgi:hypothetical protein